MSVKLQMRDYMFLTYTLLEIIRSVDGTWRTREDA